MQHPQHRIPTEIVSHLRRYAADAEKNACLHEDQLHVIYQQKWFKMFVPVHLGGLGLSLPDVLTLEEALSWTDGSVGWVVTLCSGAGWFVGFLDPRICERFGHNEKFCLAGSGAHGGVANSLSDGYEVNGSWKYASGARHATGFTANCLLQSGGAALLDKTGSPKTSAFIFEPSHVQVKESWNAMGMVATGSHSFEVNKARVSLQHAFVVDPGKAQLTDPVYQYPFLQLAETTLAATISGMAVRFIDLAEVMFESNADEKSERHLSVAVAARRMLDDARDLFYEKAQSSWDMLISQNKISADVLSDVSEVSHSLVRHARAQVNLLYPLCGLRAAMGDNEINRVWRDFQTASQHALFVR